jgi:predicted transport protein
MDQFKTILDTIEGLIHRLLVLPKLAEELEEAVPSRRGIVSGKALTQPNVTNKISSAPAGLKALYEDLDQKLRSLGEDITVRPQKHYVAFRRNRNFASVQIYNKKRLLRIYLNLDPDTVELGRSGVRDVRQIGHFGTGDLELSISSKKDIEDFTDLLESSYAES